MGLYKSLAGTVCVELTSADLPSAMGAISHLDIPFFKTEWISDLTARFTIYHRDYKELEILCEKRGETLRIISRKGLYWTGKSLLHRPVLLIGLVIMFSMMSYLPTRIFFVKVEGNLSIPSRLILAAAEDCGICFGASRREVRSEQVKNALLEAIPELQWAGVNTSGCVATISVRERTITEQEEEFHDVSSIVAIRDGIITSCTATVGNLLCQPGQVVKEGEVLISGYTDCGLTIQATRAEGEVTGQTIRRLRAVLPSQYEARTETMDIKRKISLLIGKNRINLWKDSGIWDTSCGRMYEEYYVTLPGGFQLPIALLVEQFTIYETAALETDVVAAEELLTEFAPNYVKEQMVAGQILTQDQTVAADDGFYILEGEYVCTEMIGKVQREQIGEHNGEDD